MFLTVLLVTINLEHWHCTVLHLYLLCDLL